MPHIITYTEEIEERGYCQQRPELRTGERYLHEVEGRQRLRIVLSVRFERYVWEDIALWRTEIMEFLEDEYSLHRIRINEGTPECTEATVFVAAGNIGVLSRDSDVVSGTFVVPTSIDGRAVRGVAPFGFFGCRNLTKVVFPSPLLMVYECAFAQSGIAEMEFNEEIPIMVHYTAIDGCEHLPKFDRIFDRPFPGKYLFRGGEVFNEWEKNLQGQHLI